MSKSLLLIVSSALAGCQAASASEVRSTPYSCDAITPSVQVASSDPAVIAPWRALATASATDLSWVLRVKRLARSEIETEMSTDTRVRLQHQMLRVASRLTNAERIAPTFKANVRRILEARMRALAPTVDELATLGSGALPAVHPILGPAETLVERATATCGSGSLKHVSHNGGLLAFRPLRAGTTRALVAQLVAFDRDGTPHITPLVEGIELRTGNDVSSPACVVEGGDDGILRTATHAEFTEHGPFVQRAGSGIGCINCHRAPNTMNARDIAGAELAEIDAARNGQVTRLAAEFWAEYVGDVARSHGDAR